jgi:hypothetical protein
MFIIIHRSNITSPSWFDLVRTSVNSHLKLKLYFINISLFVGLSQLFIHKSLQFLHNFQTALNILIDVVLDYEGIDKFLQIIVFSYPPQNL